MLERGAWVDGYTKVLNQLHNDIDQNQGSKEIRQWPMNWCISPMMINKITPTVHYNLKLKRFNTLWTNQSKFYIGPKVVKSKLHKKTLGTSVIKSLMFPPSLDQNTKKLWLINLLRFFSCFNRAIAYKSMFFIN